MFTTENEETQPHVNPESRRYLERIKERLFRQVASVIRTRARPIAAPFILSFASNVADLTVLPQRPPSTLDAPTLLSLQSSTRSPFALDHHRRDTCTYVGHACAFSIRIVKPSEVARDTYEGVRQRTEAYR